MRECVMAKTKDCKTCGATFEKTGQADKFCLDCREARDGVPKACTVCGEPLPIQRGPKKYCKKCSEESVRIRQFNRSIKECEGRSCVVSFPSCIVCSKRFSRPKSKNGRVEVCGKACMDCLYEKTRLESERWLNHPFYFKLSDDVVKLRNRLIRQPSKNTACTCEFCGSVKIAGDAQSRSVRKGRRFFCDQDCSWNWKSIHYASESFEHFEKSRKATRDRKQKQREISRRLAESRRMEKIERNKIKREEQKQKGWITCTVCSKTVWSESHSSRRRFCSESCKKDAGRVYSGNRCRLLRQRSFGAVITLQKLFIRDGKRCKACGTRCVKPEGYNQPNEANIDHIMPLSKGGLHTWSNVQLPCRTCNIAKSNKVLPGTQLMLKLEHENPGHQEC